MWLKGKIPVIWDEKYKTFNYSKQPIMVEEVDMWRSQGYTHNSFSGSMYDSTNPIPDWCKTVADNLNLALPGFVFYRMSTGIIMPTHIDHFNRYCKVFKVKRSNVYRAIVFLEDWKPGHYFEVDSNCIANYSAGEYILWSHDVPHAASNIGILDRYTLQITGVLNEKI